MTFFAYTLSFFLSLGPLGLLELSGLSEPPGPLLLQGTPCEIKLGIIFVNFLVQKFLYSEKKNR